MIGFILFGLILNIVFYFLDSGTKKEDEINKEENALKELSLMTPILSVQ